MPHNKATKKFNASLKIVVGGYLVRGPMGGLAWHHLQYVLGLVELGFDVLYIEDSDDYPSCFNPSDCSMSSDPEFGLRFAEGCFKELDMADIWSYYDAASEQWRGPSASKVMSFLADADVFLNLSGLMPARDWLAHIPKRVYVDTDPMFTQIRLLNDEAAYQHAKWHNAFYTFAENINQTDCLIPSVGITWHPTRQPVVSSRWTMPRYNFSMGNSSTDILRLTTVLQWDSYPVQVLDDVQYGMKSASFPTYMSLPSMLMHNEETMKATGSYSARAINADSQAVELEVAIGGQNAPIDTLSQNGWHVNSSLDVTKTLRDYQKYIRGSAAEFSVAKHGYVASRSGWFSERSANYLAAGRPVIVQDTGFSDYVPTGYGVLAFNTLSEAMDSIEELHRNYKFHCEQAIDVAESCFGAGVVLSALLEHVFYWECKNEPETI